MNDDIAMINLVRSSDFPSIRNNKSSHRPMLRSDSLIVAYDFLVLWDALAIAGSGYLCGWVYNVLLRSPSFYSGLDPEIGQVVNLAALLAPFVLYDSRWKDKFKTVSVSNMVIHIGKRFAVLMSLLLISGFLTHIVPTVPRLWVLMWTTSFILFAIGGRLLFTYFVRTAINHETIGDRVAVVGTGIAAARLLSHICCSRANGIQLVAVFDKILGPNSAASEQSLIELIDMGRRGEFDRVILALTEINEAQVFSLVYRLKALDVEVSHYVPFFGSVGAGRCLSGVISDVAGAPVVVLTPRPINSWGVVFKQIEDRLLALCLILVVAPVFGVLAIAVRLDSPGPIIFQQRRHGRNGTEFQVLKFRTMKSQDATTPNSGEVQTRRGDDRITRVGRLLRKTSLDELPQLFNVLNGTMSLVGPRPHPVVMRTEQRLGEEIIAEYSHRHRVKPGITGWAQVNGYRGATDTAEQVRKRVEHDLYYIENWSLLLDLWILAITPFKVLFERTNAF